MQQSWRIQWVDVEPVKGPLGSGAPRGFGDKTLGSVSNASFTRQRVSVGVSRGYTDHYQGRGHSIRLTATLINIHEHLI